MLLIVGTMMMLVGLVVLAFSADWLVRGSVDVARRFRVSPLVIGLTIVAMGTSAPELITGIIAVTQGQEGIVLGNAIGSNIANLGLVLGITALIGRIPVCRKATWFDGIFVLTLTGVTCMLAWDHWISRSDGAVLILILLSIMVFSITHQSGNQPSSDSSDTELLKSGLLASGLIVIGLIGLAGGAQLLVSGAVRLAEFFGVSDTLIGATAVALGTSAPELAASIAAARRKHYAIMIGNLLGSCQINLALIIGVPAIIKPLSTSPALLTIHLPALAIVSIIAWIFLQTGGKVLRRQGAVLFALYIAYITVVMLFGG